MCVLYLFVCAVQTKCGKALGRWINNQRSAKSKCILKREREDRLVSTGLKWSVLTTHVWTDMMEELRIYVQEKVRSNPHTTHAHVYQVRVEMRIWNLTFLRFVVVVYLKPILQMYG
jgi:hypothetical protein